MQTAQRTPPVWDEEVTRLWDEPSAFANESTTQTPRPRPRSRSMPEEPPEPTGAWRRRLATAGLVLLLGLAVLALSTDWLRVRVDDLRYGRPRTTHLSAVVGHNDGDGLPTHLIALNLDRRITIIELPGGDPAKARLIPGPYLVGQGEDLTPATMRTQDVNGDGHADLLVRVKNEEVVYINDSGEFRLMTRAERPAVERALGGDQ